MRERNNELVLWPTDGELKHLNHMAEKSGLSRSAYIRKILAGAKVTEIPKDYREFNTALIRIESEMRLLERFSSLSEKQRAELRVLCNALVPVIEKINAVYDRYFDWDGR